MTEREVSSERVSDASWLEAAAIYFENRPTNGEDASHWANVANAERCRSIAAALEAPTPQEAPSEVTDSMVQKAWEAYDAKGGYSKPERFRAAITAALKGDR